VYDKGTCREEDNLSSAQQKLMRVFSEFIQGKVEERLAKSIVCMNDCSLLASHIFEQTNLKISEATICGLLGIKCNRKEPTLFTLEVFAKYLGYDSSVQMLTEFNTKSFEELNQIEFNEYPQYTCTCVSVECFENVK